MRGHKKRLLEYLETHEGITSLEAINLLGNTRISETVRALREMGYPIVSVWQEGENRYGEKTRFVKYVLKY